MPARVWWIIRHAARPKITLPAYLATFALNLSLGLHLAVALAHPLAYTKRRRDSPLMGQWLAANTDPDSSVAMLEGDIISSFPQRRVIDLLGMATPANVAPLSRMT